MYCGVHKVGGVHILCSTLQSNLLWGPLREGSGRGGEGREKLGTFDPFDSKRPCHELTSNASRSLLFCV